MVKYGYKETAECTLCKKAHEESVPKETIGHIQSAGCVGQEGVPIPNRYTAKAKLCFCKNNKRRIIK
jgi:hypothetical protein